MPRLTINPNTLQCPDYGLQIYQAARQPLVNDNCTDDQAAQILRGAWTATNEAEKAQWQAQEQADAEEENDRRRTREEEEVVRELQKRQDKEEARKEEEKKNNAKYAPIPKRGIPDRPPCLPSLWAIKKLEKGDYVQLWHFTNRGLDSVCRSFHNSDNDAMTLTSDSNGNPVWVLSASTEAKGIVEDHDLSWEDFCIAAPRMIDAMTAAKWPNDRVQMMVKFWVTIQHHEYRSSPDPTDLQTLLLYQAKQRRNWHYALRNPATRYDLSDSNESILRITKEKVYCANRRQKDDERDHIVRLSPFTLRQPH